MMPVSGYDDFVNKFTVVQNRARLFAFILFDDRPSQKAMQKFVDEQMDWLDDLAASAKMFCFAFLCRDRGGISNPSLEVARLFGLRPNQLPGVVIFRTFAESDKVNEGLFLPLEAQLFNEEPQVVEDVFADLFSVLQEVQTSTATDGALIREVSRHIGSLVRAQKARPVIKFLRERLQAIAKLPDKLVESVGSAFGNAIVKQFGI